MPAQVSKRVSAPQVHLPGLLAFAIVARELNFARAAAELAVTPTAISKTIKQLESQLGVRLFNRTTRSVSLTEPGAQLLESVRPALDQIAHSISRLGELAERPHGTLRINTSLVAYASLIEPHLPTFLARHPQLTLEIAIDNALSDIVGEGFDAGIRLGHALHRDMVALPLGPLQRRLVVATPGYFAQHGKPETPEDLLRFDCIRQRLISRNRFYDWTFHKRGRPLTIEVSGRLVFDEMRSVRQAAVQGCGIAFVFRQFAARELDSGTLVCALEKFCPPTEAFHIYFAHRAQMPAKLRVFVDFIRAANWKLPA